MQQQLKHQDGLPHDRQTEVNVLGTVIRNNELFADTSDVISKESFYETKLSDIWRCVQGVIERGDITTVSALREYANANRIELDQDVLIEAMTTVSELSFQQDVKNLRRMQQQRTLWEIYVNAANNIIAPLADIREDCETTARRINDAIADKNADGIATFSQAIQDVKVIIDNNDNGIRNYIQTGFRLFDEHYVLRENTLTVLAAFTSVGKSALSMNIAVNVARSGIPVAYYSREMAKEELTARAISSAAQITSGRILNARLSDLEKMRFAQAEKQLGDLHIMFDDKSTTSWKRTMRSIRTMVRTYGVKLVVIDYLQIYSQIEGGDDVEGKLAEMIREAKNIAKELSIAVLVLSQLNRSAQHPNIKMLRGSGQIEESADNIVLIDRPEAYPDNMLKYEGDYANESTRGTAKLILAKGRGVGTGVALVGFTGEYTQFFEREQPQREYNDYTKNERELNWSDTPF